MIKTLKRWAPLVTTMFMVATPAFSQAPTDAQRDAIRSECRSDYQAHCASIPPGGEASLQCLQKNVSSLSPGCQNAVKAVAVAAPAAPKAESAPAAAPAKPAAATAAPAATPKAAASTPAKKPSDAQVTAIRTACRSDYQKVCAGVPAGGTAALQCLEKNKTKVSAPCEKAVSAAGTVLRPPPARTATAAPAAAASGARCGNRRADRHGAAPDAAARGIVRAEVGLQRRRSHALRQCRTRWRPHHAMPGDAGRRDLACLQGRTGAVRSAMTDCAGGAGGPKGRFTPRERRGSAGSGGRIARRSRSSSRSDTRHAIPALPACRGRRGNSAPAE